MESIRPWLLSATGLLKTNYIWLGRPFRRGWRCGRGDCRTGVVESPCSPASARESAVKMFTTCLASFIIVENHMVNGKTSKFHSVLNPAFSAAHHPVSQTRNPSSVTSRCAPRI